MTDIPVTPHVGSPTVKPMPDVKRVCKRCAVSEDAVAAGWCLVSPSGTAHHGGTWDAETDCGKDATGPGWWWPL